MGGGGGLQGLAEEQSQGTRAMDYKPRSLSVEVKKEVKRVRHYGNLF